MRAVVQRVVEAEVTVAGEVVGAVGSGLAVLVGVEAGDGSREVEALASKLVGLRVFSDGDGRMNRSVLESGGAVLVISQFTLLADVRKGRRPSFTRAAAPELAEPLVVRLTELLRSAGVACATGRFGAAMAVHLVNDGPVTLVIDVRDGRIL